jgi:hypothetical protein
VRFLRHLAAAGLVVAVVVVLGLAWNHFAASSLVGNLEGSVGRVVIAGRPASRPPPGVELPGRKAPADGPHGPGVIRLLPENLGLGSMFNPANLPDLRHTVVIEAGVIAAVVIIEINVRLSRRAKRERQLAVSRSADDDGEGQ